MIPRSPEGGATVQGGDRDRKAPQPREQPGAAKHHNELALRDVAAHLALGACCTTHACKQCHALPTLKAWRSSECKAPSRYVLVSRNGEYRLHVFGRRIVTLTSSHIASFTMLQLP